MRLIFPKLRLLCVHGAGVMDNDFVTTVSDFASTLCNNTPRIPPFSPPWPTMLSSMATAQEKNLHGSREGRTRSSRVSGTFSRTRSQLQINKATLNN